MAEQISEKICEKIENICSGKIDEKSISLILVYSMQIAEDTRNLSGMEKKEICIQAIKLAIKKHEKDDQKQKYLIEIVDKVIPGMIDAIVASATSNNNLSFKKNKKHPMLCC